MEITDIPEQVLQFLDERIDSVPHLESLLLLWNESAREWRAEELAARIYVSEDHARAILLALQRKELVDRDAHADTFRYREAWNPQPDFMRQVAMAYSRNLVQITKSIHARGSNSVREFARAFDLKKDR